MPVNSYVLNVLRFGAPIVENWPVALLKRIFKNEVSLGL